MVYFASGDYKKEYESLPFDRIYLVDFCFKRSRSIIDNYSTPTIIRRGKVICLGMDCLSSIKYLKSQGVQIDCIVTINEGLFEGGGVYPINSDMFLGYVIPILKDEYIHIVNEKYYLNSFHVTMDLPYEKSEIFSTDSRYLDPSLFSSDKYHIRDTNVYWMKKKISKIDVNLNPKIRITIIHDSIWCHYDDLDLLGILILNQGQGDFFDRIKKVVSLMDFSIEEIFDLCVQKRVINIGFIPWGRGNYDSFIDFIKSYKKDFPQKVTLFHLNKSDFKRIRSSEVIPLLQLSH